MTDFDLDTFLELLQLADELAEAAENSDSTEAQQHKTPREKNVFFEEHAIERRKGSFSSTLGMIWS